MKRLALALLVLCVPVPALAQDGSAAADRVYEIVEVDSMPRPANVADLQSALRTAYPPALLQAGRGGRVLLSFVVAADGSVGQTRVVESTDPAFDAPSLSSIAVLRWRPGRLAGSPVATRVEIPIEWKVPPPPAEAPQVAAAPEPRGESSGPQLENPEYLKNALRRLYPPEAVAQCVNATVQVEIRLEADGSTSQMRVVRSSDSRFNQPSIQALTGARFRPARLDGRNVAMTIILPLQWECQWQQ